jgi:hypothetical protein
MKRREFLKLSGLFAAAVGCGFNALGDILPKTVKEKLRPLLKHIDDSEICKPGKWAG